MKKSNWPVIALLLVSCSVERGTKSVVEDSSESARIDTAGDTNCPTETASHCPKCAQTPLPVPEGFISSEVPAELNAEGGGPRRATFEQAAEHAWRMFFALNWPARRSPDGRVLRDLPSTTEKFGDVTTAPTVWQSYRGKVELYSGNVETVELELDGRRVEVARPPGYDPTRPDYGYDEPPQYLYDKEFGEEVRNGTNIPPCDSEVSTPAWNNLDEVTEIGFNASYAGVIPDEYSPVNTDPRRIRYLAKTNKQQYVYVMANRFWFGLNDPLIPTGKGGSAVSDDNPTPFEIARERFRDFVADKGRTTRLPEGTVDFPDGTIEVKAGWRMLAPQEDPKRFHVQRVRYYDEKPQEGGEPVVCYREGDWALIALHIIQKTPGAPYFIYSTFEQADNILSPDGQRVEDENGCVINPPEEDAVTTPPLVYTPSTQGEFTATPKVETQPPDSFCEDPGQRLYYVNTPDQNGAPNTHSTEQSSGGRIALNRRFNEIPCTVIKANEMAHEAMARFSAEARESPWMYYKLVNVQWRPFNLEAIEHGEPDSRNNAATYYMANSVVETNFMLARYTGQILIDDDPEKTEFNGPPNIYPLAEYSRNAPIYPYFHSPGGPTSPTIQNVLMFDEERNLIETYNMGGCMGCHGNAQAGGTDFSFIIGFPEEPETPTSAGVSQPSLGQSSARPRSQEAGQSQKFQPRSSQASKQSSMPAVARTR